MKRFVATWTTFCALSLGSFGVLLFEDRTLDVPLPYSLPIAFASMLILTPVLLVLGRGIAARQPVRQAAATPYVSRQQAQPAAPPPRCPAQGVVLLDFSGLTAKRSQGA